MEVYGSSYTVFHENTPYSCVLRGRFRRTLGESHNPIAVGDYVTFTPLDGGAGIIEELLPRRNKISRPTKWGPVKERIIAANVDQVVAVVSVKDPPLKTGLIDRLLLVSEREGLPCVICINKTDLVEPGDIREEVSAYRRLQYTVLPMSALTGAGTEALRDVLTERFSVFLGQSGVGKSSLLNALQPGLGLKVREISRSSGKGRHTTSYVTAVSCDFGGVIADTPGFRNFGIWGIGRNEVCLLFREFPEFAEKCMFRPCLHLHEPGCAVKEAYENGEIMSWRYENYVRIYNSYDEKDSGRV